MGKNSGTTRSGGSSNPKGAGERMNTYADFNKSQRLNILLNNIQKFVDQLDEAAKADDTTSDYVASLLDNGQEAIAEYVKAATSAARGLRQGRELAEEAIEDNEEDLRDKLYASHAKAATTAGANRQIDKLIPGRLTSHISLRGTHFTITLSEPARPWNNTGEYDIVDDTGESWGGTTFEWTEEGRKKAFEEIKKQLREIARG